MKRSISWLRGLSKTKRVLLGIATLFVVAGVAGSGQQSGNLNSSSAASELQTQQSQAQQSKVPKAPTLTSRTETETQTIPFTTTTVNDATLAKGTTKVTTAGVNGSQTVTYKVTYSNGKQTDKKLISTAVVTQPITQITSVGTYVAPTPPAAPANTYTNVDGNQIESPDSNSAGATGVCNDGTYTHAVHHQGACSSHGGVDYWL